MFNRNTSNFLKGAFGKNSRLRGSAENIKINESSINNTITANPANRVNFNVSDVNSTKSFEKIVVSYEPSMNDKILKISNFLSIKNSDFKYMFNIEDMANMSDEIRNTVNELFGMLNETTEKRFYYKLFWTAEEPLLGNKSPIKFLKLNNTITSQRIVMGLFRKSFKE